MRLSEVYLYHQPNHFETQVTVIPILKMENKNRERGAPSCERTGHGKFHSLSLV